MIEWKDTMSSEERFGLNEPDLSVTEEPEKDAKEIQRAIAKAMQLLLYRQRTEKELREKLREKEFSSDAEEAAVGYVSSFGYLDDRRYAEVYLHSQKGKKSRAMIRRELKGKGVSAEWIDLAFEEDPEDEGDMIYALLCRRSGAPHKMDEKELRRNTQYLARKGFSAADIVRQIRRFQQAEQNCE